MTLKAISRFGFSSLVQCPRNSFIKVHFVRKTKNKRLILYSSSDLCSQIESYLANETLDAEFLLNKVKVAFSDGNVMLVTVLTFGVVFIRSQLQVAV